MMLLDMEDILSSDNRKTLKRLVRKDATSLVDLLYWKPRIYAPLRRVAEVGLSEEVVVRGVVLSADPPESPDGRKIYVNAWLEDESGVIKVTWWQRPEMFERLSRLVGSEIGVHGVHAKRAAYGLSYVKEEFYDPRVLGPLLPVYREVGGVKSWEIRELIRALLVGVEDLDEPLPAGVPEALNLPTRAEAVRTLHLPQSVAELERAERRFAFEELVWLRLVWSPDRTDRAPNLGEPGELASEFRATIKRRSLVLTSDQERAIADIDADLCSSLPMHLVALYALLRAVENGYQAVLMAPTETLAEQHLETLRPYCDALGTEVALLTSSTPLLERDALLRQLSEEQPLIVVGTHALLQDGVSFPRLGLAVVDEQHRFGVEQRDKLVGASGAHQLQLSATPIPRTLAAVLYGELNVSALKELPGARKPVVTEWWSELGLPNLRKRVAAQLGEGEQAYVICPRIGSNEDGLFDAVWVADEFGLKLPGFRVGLVHGNQHADERQGAIEAFRRRELDVLVATTLVGVGIDVPGATIMIVLNAERFGLQELHQLRGRVQRSDEQGFCALVTADELSADAEARIVALLEHSDGFSLAEIDLALRGEGDLPGTKQSGRSGFRFAQLARDYDLADAAGACADEIRNDAARTTILAEWHNPGNDS